MEQFSIQNAGLKMLGKRLGRMDPGVKRPPWQSMAQYGKIVNQPDAARTRLRGGGR
ncbi:MAG: hypothetical protein ACRECY_08850 [Phyllobacterium sp.]